MTLFGHDLELLLPIVGLVVAAILPAMLLLRLFHSVDLKPEPLKVLWTTFALGILCVLVVLPLRKLLPYTRDDDLCTFANLAVYSFIGVGLSEELSKALVLIVYSTRHDAFDEPMDGLVYGAAASLGFAAFENVDYVLIGGWQAALTRGLLAVPTHACLGAILGYYMGLVRMQRDRKALHFILGLAIPTLLHGAYDLPLFAAGCEGATIGWLSSTVETVPVMPLIFVVVEVALVVWLIRRLRAEQAAAGPPPPIGAVPWWSDWVSFTVGVAILVSVAMTSLKVMSYLSEFRGSDIADLLVGTLVAPAGLAATLCAVSAVRIVRRRTRKRAPTKGR